MTEQASVRESSVRVRLQREEDRERRRRRRITMEESIDTEDRETATKGAMDKIEAQRDEF
ncbi:hypothetical protein F2Q69_00021140 [Brassica cretica]|uniref:Uncharacterized protein n=1 Tax=Brassica cretica TaxID=69181 RepID=A0A8S9Q0Y5_BRACR|nr:hypothetical protein F2Q69_00021140 [Brassica cretica]